MSTDPKKRYTWSIVPVGPAPMYIHPDFPREEGKSDNREEALRDCRRSLRTLRRKGCARVFWSVVEHVDIGMWSTCSSIDGDQIRAWKNRDRPRSASGRFIKKGSKK